MNLGAVVAKTGGPETVQVPVSAMGMAFGTMAQPLQSLGIGFPAGFNTVYTGPVGGREAVLFSGHNGTFADRVQRLWTVPIDTFTMILAGAIPAGSLGPGFDATLL